MNFTFIRKIFYFALLAIFRKKSEKINMVRVRFLKYDFETKLIC